MPCPSPLLVAEGEEEEKVPSHDNRVGRGQGEARPPVWDLQSRFSQQVQHQGPPPDPLGGETLQV